MLKWDGYNKLVNTIILWCNVRYQELKIYISYGLLNLIAVI